MEFLKNLKKLINPFFKQAVFLIVVMFLFEASRLISPYLMKELLDTVIAWQEQFLGKLINIIVLMFAVELLILFFDYFIDRQNFKLIINVERNLFYRAHQKLLGLSLSYHEKENTGSKIIKIQRGIDRLMNLLEGFLWDFGPVVFQIIVTFIFIYFLDWQMALIFIFFIPWFLLVTLRMNFLARPWRERANIGYEDSAGMMAQNIINIKTVQSFAQEKRALKSHSLILNKIYNAENKRFGIFLNGNLARGFMIDIGRLAVLGFGVFQTFNGHITAGSLVMFVTLSEKVYFSLFRLSRIYDRIMDNVETVKRLNVLLAEESAVKNKPNAFKVKDLKGEIEFRHVCFSYDHVNQALKDISFKIEPGETVAVVGPSGGGKTTLVKLLYRHFDVDKGQILIDGQNLDDLDLCSYRQKLGIVTQDIDIFNDTVKNNIAYAKPAASLAKVEKVARIAYANSFVNKFKDGYDTLVGERGVKLSGGQKQRIGIARAILAKPKILIFDEATSSLDSESERYIQEALKRLAGRYTTLIIAHRLSTVYRADKILVLDHGQLIEAGTHQQLRERKGLYSRLLKLQTLKELW